MNLLKYSLTLGKKEKTSFSNDAKTQLTIGGCKLDVSLYGVSFQRQVYQPGHIEAEILMSTEEMTEGAAPGVDALMEFFLNQAASLSVNGTDVATGYYVYEISPQYEKGSRAEVVPVMGGKRETIHYKYDIYVKLDIFSPDKKMMLNRYSRAYLGKCLVGDIVSDGIAIIDSGIALKVGELQHSTYFTKEDTYDVSEYGEGDQKKKLVSKESLKTVSKELIHPYLVQYNESFHSFISRVANRIGEVFYFEDGSFCVGIPDKKAADITHARRIVYQGISGSPLSVRDYARDSVKGKWKWEDEGKDTETLKVDYDLGTKEIVPDAIDNLSDDGFPLDAFPRPEQKNKNKVFSHYYNSEIASEDQYILLYKDKFARDGFGDVLWGNTDEHLMGWLSDILNSTSLMKLLSKAAVKGAKALIKSEIKKGEKNDKGNNKMYEWARRYDEKYAVLLAKVDNKADHWVTLNYYYDIRSKEEEQMRKTVCVDMGSGFQDVKLGDRIKIPNDSRVYVVTRIDMVSGNSWQRSYDGLAGGGSEKGERMPSQRIYAIPLTDKLVKNEKNQEETKAVFYPPLLPGSPFRQCGPQPAFVTDADDPKNQGRVRVRYPWQASLKKVKDDLEDAEKKKENYHDTFKSAKTTFEAYASFDLNVDTSEIDNNTDWDDDKKKEERNKKKEQAKKYAEDYEWDYEKKNGVDKNKYETARLVFEDVRGTYISLVKEWKAAKRKLLVEEAATPWIRMATPMATSGGGMFFRPEVGDEVMVDFENGNIERPYVVGTLYSKNLTVPDAGDRVIVSRNGHTIKMSDPTDGLEFVAGAYPGLKFLQSFGTSMDSWELNEKERCVLGGIEMTDKYGFYNIKMSSSNRNISISSPFGDIDVDAFTGINIKAPNGDIKISGKNVEISAFNKVTVKSGKNIDQLGKKYYGSGNRIGFLSDFANIEDELKDMGRSLVYAFFDFSLLRSIFEIFVRPIDGTLEIKSNRYMLLEAGPGKAVGEVSQYAKHRHDRWHGKDADNAVLIDLLDTISNRVDSFLDGFVRTFNSVKTPESFFTLEYGMASRAINQPNSKVNLIHDMLIQHAWVDDDQLDADYNAYIADAQKFSCTANSPLFMQRQVKAKVKDLMRSLTLLKKNIEDYKHLFDDVDARFTGVLDENALMAAVVPNGVDDADLFVAAFSKIKQFIDNAQQADEHLFENQLNANSFTVWKKYMKRKLVHDVIEHCRNNPNSFKTFSIPAVPYGSIRTVDADGKVTITAAPAAANPISNTEWPHYVAAIRLAEPTAPKSLKEKALEMGEALGKDVLKTLSPWEPDVWDVGSRNGRILFSDEEEMTYRFKGGATERYRNFKNRMLAADESEIKGILEKL